MSPQQLTITLDGAERIIEEGTTGTTLFEGDRDVVAMKVDGEPWDLSRELHTGAVVEPIMLASQDGKAPA